MTTHAKHPPYVAIWVFLLALLGVSLALGYLGNVALATTLIFGIAAVKALVVAIYYMRLKWEPNYVPWIFWIGLIFMVILFFGLIPDIVHQYGRIGA